MLGKCGQAWKCSHASLPSAPKNPSNLRERWAAENLSRRRAPRTFHGAGRQSAVASAAIRHVTAKLTKPQLVNELLSAKEATGKTFSQIGKELGVTNLYAAQLIHNQAQLKPGTVEALRKAVPGINDDHIEAMERCPMRSYDPSIEQEPHIYRMKEAVLHYGEAVKAVMNEELGDGIMSAIDMFAEVKVIEGAQGEKRVLLSLNGKFLPHIEQRTENNTAP